MYFYDDYDNYEYCDPTEECDDSYFNEWYGYDDDDEFARIDSMIYDEYREGERCDDEYYEFFNW